MFNYNAQMNQLSEIIFSEIGTYDLCESLLVERVKFEPQSSSSHEPCSTRFRFFYFFLPFALFLSWSKAVIVIPASGRCVQLQVLIHRYPKLYDLC